jgi:hypothetical protein
MPEPPGKQGLVAGIPALPINKREKESTILTPAAILGWWAKRRWSGFVSLARGI